LTWIFIRGTESIFFETMFQVFVIVSVALMNPSQRQSEIAARTICTSRWCKSKDTRGYCANKSLPLVLLFQSPLFRLFLLPLLLSTAFVSAFVGLLAAVLQTLLASFLNACWFQCQHRFSFSSHPSYFCQLCVCRVRIWCRGGVDKGIFLKQTAQSHAA
jgi:hypothetical protein